MSNNQTKDLNKVPAVKELSSETAANVQGGWNIDLYDGPFWTGYLGSANYAFPTLRRANNDISSVKISQGVWNFYDGFYGSGGLLGTYGRGWHSFLGKYINNRTSSLYKQ